MFRISKPQDGKYQYALNVRDARLLRRLGNIGFLATCFMVLGYIQFLHISPYVAAFFGPVLAVIVLHQLIQYFLLSVYPGFDIDRHRQKIASYWLKRRGVPRIAVFIPAAGEAINVVAGTVRAAVAIRYPNFQVFILDDSKEGIYKQLASDLRVTYIRRKDVGVHKKAGNMNYALKRIAGYDNILVLDADFQPRPEILHELVPYTNEDVGIVQSPQHFALDKHAHARSKIEYGAAYIQQDFYRVTQVARNRFGAAICVGTCALYSIEALNRVGGYEGVGQPRGWSHSEDVHTGLKMLNAYNASDQRYKIVYVPVQLATGSCPDTHESFYKQQNRWATGSMQLIFSSKTVRSGRLSLMQRVIYGSNSLYYFYTMTLLVSPLYLLVLALSSPHSSWAFTLYFVPALAFRYLIEPYVMRKQRAPLATSIVVLSNAYTFLQAAMLLIIRKPLGWEATGMKSRKKSAHFTQFKLGAAIVFVVLYILTLGVLIMNESFQFGPSIFIIYLFLTSFLAHIAFLFYTLIVGSNSSRLITDRKFYAMLILSVLTTVVIFASYSYHARYNVVLHDYHISFVRQNNVIKPTTTLLDGYRRTAGDIKHLFGL